MLINRTTDAHGVPSLVVDYGQGIQDLAEHLVELGPHPAGIPVRPAAQCLQRLRLQGLETFKAAHPQVDVHMLEGGSDFDTGHEAVDAVLASGATGILAFNDLVAMGLISGLHERGVHVPGDISVTGFDDIPFAKYTTPALTTAAVPITELGEQAWQRMIETIRSARLPAPTATTAAPLAASAAVEDADDGAHAPLPTIFHPKLTVRGSTGPAAVHPGPQ